MAVGGRHLTLELPDDLPNEQYIDLAHAVWSVALAALGPDANFRLVRDGQVTNRQLNERWSQLGEYVKWKPAPSSDPLAG
jgi:hypothetical protein